jgi:PTS system nitrogen regulatory IIA component
MNPVPFRAIKSFLSRGNEVEHRCGHPAGKAGRGMKALAELLLPKDILLDVCIPGKSELLDKIGRHMEWVHGIPATSVIRSLEHRERIGSTALGQGIAIPHARIRELDRIQLAYLRLKLPIPFDAPDGKPISDVLVILVPRSATEEHLRILAETSQMFSDPRFREQLHRCTHPAEVKQLFDSWPETLF